MKITLNFSDLQDMTMEHAFPDNYHHIGEPIVERTTALECFGGTGTYREIFFEGVHIAFGDLRLKHQTVLHFESDFETVEMHFDLSGNTLTNISGTNSMHYEFNSNHHNIIYVPGIKGNLHFNTMSTQVLEINLSIPLFKKFIADTEIFTDFIRHINQQDPAMLGKHNMPITPAMVSLIRSILDCRKVGMYKRMYLEAKVVELLLLQLEQFAFHDCNSFCSLKPADMEKMHHARDIIFTRANEVHSLRRLALEIGTNEFTLKKGFKEVFGTTVFGMLSDLKMEEAKRLLSEGEKSISEISEYAGYKNSTHFTSAFKKKYGITPGKYKVELCL